MQIFAFHAATNGPSITVSGSASLAYEWKDAIAAMAILSRNVPSNSIQQATVVADSNEHHEAVMYFVANPIESTGLALLNTYPTDIRIMLTFYDSLGKEILRDTVALKPNAHRAFSLNDKYPALVSAYGSSMMRIKAVDGSGNQAKFNALGFLFDSYGSFTTMYPMEMTQGCATMPGR